MLLEIKYRTHERIVIVETNLTYGNWLEIYLKAYRQNGIKKTSYRQLELIRDKIPLQLRCTEITKIFPFVLQQFVNEFCLAASESYANKMMNLIRSSFRKAYENDLVPRNPASDLKLALIHISTALGHSYGKWTVTKEATTITEGNRTRTCSRCGAKETQTVPMKVESENQPKIDPALRQSDIYKAVTLLNPDTDFTNPNKGGKIVYDDSWGCWDGFTDNGNYKTATRMCCASFVNFYLWNYLPNIAGKSSGVTWKTDPDRSCLLYTSRCV